MERFRRMLRQRGPKKAVVAVAKPAQTTTTRHQSQRVTRHALQTLERPRLTRDARTRSISVGHATADFLSSGSCSPTRPTS